MPIYSNDGRSPVVKFRLKPYIIKILENHAKSSSVMSADIMAKSFCIDGMLKAQLIPLANLPELMQEVGSDWKSEIMTYYKLTEKDWEVLVKKLGEVVPSSKKLWPVSK